MRIILPGILLLYSSITDIVRREINIGALVVFGILGMLCAVFGKDISWMETIFGVVIGLILVLVSVMTRGELGMGDGILICITGLYIGFSRNILLVMVALMLSAFFSMVLLLIKKNMKLEYPFVPFLLMSYMIQLLIR